MRYDISDFQREVIQRSFELPVLVDFWAEWCGPCKVLGPVLERLAEQNGGAWELAKVNTEDLIDVAQYYRIQSIPNVKLFYEGLPIAEFTGALPEYAIKQWLEQHVPGKNQKSIEQVKRLVDEERTEEALELLEQILTAEPEQAEAKAILAVLIVFDDPARARELLSGIEEPRLSELTETVATLLHCLETEANSSALPEDACKELYRSALAHLRAREFEEALKEFIEVIRANRYYDDDGSRKACIAIFKYLGEEHPITANHRKEFSRALY